RSDASNRSVILGLIGPGAITAVVVLHGAGNGLLTIAKGTVPLAIFGPVGYGLRSGILGAPARATQAASPLLFGLLMDHMGIRVLTRGKPGVLRRGNRLDQARIRYF